MSLHPLPEAPLPRRVPDAPGLPYQVVLRHEPEQAGIANIHRIIGSHPVIILAKRISLHGLSLHIQCIMTNLCRLVFMRHNRIAEQGHIPGIHLHRNTFRRNHIRMHFRTVLFIQRNQRNPSLQFLRNQVIFILAKTPYIPPRRKYIRPAYFL